MMGIIFLFVPGGHFWEKFSSHFVGLRSHLQLQKSLIFDRKHFDFFIFMDTVKPRFTGPLGGKGIRLGKSRSTVNRGTISLI